MVRHLYILLSLIALCACSGGGGGSADGGLDREIYAPRYATGFSISGAEGRLSTVISTKAPWQGADSLTRTRLLILRGDEEVPAGFEGSVMRGDARRIVCMSSSYIAMLEALGEADRVVGVSGLDYICSPAIRSHADRVKDVGFDGEMDFEGLLALKPDVVLLYGVDGAGVMEPKLRELGIPFMYIGEYLEENPLGKAEWMVAIGELIGLRDRAIERFSAIPERYNALAQKAASTKERPRVMINTPYGGSWVMASPTSYVARLIADAGGNYAYAQMANAQNAANASQAIDLEEAYRMADQSDIWLNTGQIYTLEDLRRSFPKFADTKPVGNRQVWNCTRRMTPYGANDYWESGVVNPDLVLRDLIMIFHPGLIEEPFTYYKNIAEK